MRTTIAAAIVAASLAAACSPSARKDEPKPLPPDQAADVLDKRVWLDKEPKGWKDAFNLLIFSEDVHGVHQAGTVWKGAYEVFIYEADGNKLDVRMPGSSRVVKTTFRVDKVKRGEADVKLTIDKPFAGPATYYGYRFDGHAEDFVETKFGHLVEN